MMLALLTAFALVHFDAAWGWWIGFGCILTIEAIAVILKGVSS